MITYDQPLRQTYTLLASAVATSGTKLTVMGPAGRKGRLAAMGAVVTTATTATVSIISVGITGTLGKFGSLTIPVGAAVVTTANAMVDLTTDANLIPADTPVLISSNGGSTAGAADLTVTIDWF